MEMHNGRVSGWGTPDRDAYSILAECGSWSEIKSMGQGWEKDPVYHGTVSRLPRYVLVYVCRANLTEGQWF